MKDNTIIIIILVVLSIVIWFDTKAIKNLVMVIEQQTLTINTMYNAEKDFINDFRCEIDDDDCYELNEPLSTRE